MRKLMADEHGNKYVAVQTVHLPPGADATMTHITHEMEMRNGNPIWTSAVYEVSAEGVEPVQITRRRGGRYDVPAKGAIKLGMKEAIRIALGRTDVPPPREWVAPVAVVVAGQTAGRDGHGRSTEPTSGTGPRVIPEPQDNWTLKQGDRIMRHLALYPEGVGAQTLSAGLHEISTTAIRGYLSKMAKVAGGPVEKVANGVYKRRS